MSYDVNFPHIERQLGVVAESDLQMLRLWRPGMQTYSKSANVKLTLLK